jgi:hypothetical protein
MGYKEQQEAERLKAMLLRIYQCKKPFELMVIGPKGDCPWRTDAAA